MHHGRQEVTNNGLVSKPYLERVADALIGIKKRFRYVHDIKVPSK